MRKFLWIMLLAFSLGCSQKTPRPDAEGNIHHPTYGTYPATVPFERGMTLMPGQRTEVTIEIPLSPGLLENICLRDGGSPEDCQQYHVEPKEGGVQRVL